jgi:hypothetical protein
MAVYHNGVKVNIFKRIIVKMISACKGTFSFEDEYGTNPIPFSAPGSGDLTTVAQNVVGAINEAAGGGLVPHAPTHEDGGSDEVDVTDLLGVLADEQDAGWFLGRALGLAVPNVGDVYAWNGAAWVPVAQSGGSVTDDYVENNSTEVTDLDIWLTAVEFNTLAAGTWAISWSCETQVDFVFEPIMDARVRNLTDGVDYARFDELPYDEFDDVFSAQSGVWRGTLAEPKRIAIQFKARDGDEEVSMRRARMWALKVG